LDGDEEGGGKESKLSLEWLAGGGIEMQSPFPASNWSDGWRGVRGTERQTACPALPMRVCAHSLTSPQLVDARRHACLSALLNTMETDHDAVRPHQLRVELLESVVAVSGHHSSRYLSDLYWVPGVEEKGISFLCVRRQCGRLVAAR
jgi:hypothetical protein